MIARSLARLALAALLAAPLFVPVPAQSASQVMCAPINVAAGANRRVVVTSSTATTQPVYTLNGSGCAVIAQADVGFFLSQGYTPGPPLATILYTTGVATLTTDIVIGNVPAGAYIHQIIVSNSTANAVTGGISFGTSANGTEIVTALTCGANCLTHVVDSAMTKRVFSLTAATPIHAAAVTAWNSANVTITLIYGYF